MKLLLSLFIFITFSNCLYAQDHKEEINLQNVYVEETIPVRLSLDDLILKLGQPDSIKIESGWDCGNYLDIEMEVKLYYFKNTSFMVSGEKALLYEYYPSKKGYSLQSDSFIIDGELTTSRLKSLYPKSYDELEKELQKDPYYEKRVRIYFKSIFEGTEPSAYIFLIEEDKVIKIYYWAFIR